MLNALTHTLVGDVGGTNVRLAMVNHRAGSLPEFSNIERLAGDDFATLELAIQHYMTKFSTALKPTSLGLAVASPIIDDQVSLTNRGWSFSQRAMQDHLGLQNLTVMNDFAAVAAAVPTLLSHGGCTWITKAPQHTLTGTVTVCGAGTGFGVAAVMMGDSKPRIMSGEGGHASFAAIDDVDVDILRDLSRQFGRVSNERLLSGRGIENIYDALCRRAGTTPKVGHNAAMITTQALANADPICLETLHRFCMILGSAASDLALIHFAQAVMIAGGIVPRFIEFLQESKFHKRFTTKGRFSALLETIPIAVITHDEPGLLGVAMMQG